MAKFNFLSNALTFWFRAQTNYGNLKANEELRAKSVRLGVLSIICSSVGAVLGAVFLWGFIASIGVITSGETLGGALVAYIFWLVLCIAGTITAIVQGTLNGLMYMIYQRKLNKRGIGKAALIVWIVSIVVYIGLGVLLALLV